MAKQRKPPATRMGRPPIYGDRTRILILLPVDVAARLTKRAAKLEIKRNVAIEQAVRAWLGEPGR